MPSSIEKLKFFSQNDEGIMGVILALLSAIEFREPYMTDHSQKVTINALKVAEKMGMEKDRIKLLKYAGLLHDIGKIAIYG